MMLGIEKSMTREGEVIKMDFIHFKDTASAENWLYEYVNVPKPLHKIIRAIYETSSDLRQMRQVMAHGDMKSKREIEHLCFVYSSWCRMSVSEVVEVYEADVSFSAETEKW